MIQVSLFSCLKKSPPIPIYFGGKDLTKDINICQKLYQLDKVPDEE